MSTITKTQPQFCTVSQIGAGHHCYNVYVKVVKATPSSFTRPSGDVVKIVEGVVADSTGCANFRFDGENVGLIKEGDIIAIRNGRSQVVSDHIRLEVDKFGRITKEDAKNVSGQVNTTNDISSVPYERKKRDDRGDRDRERGDRRSGPRRNDDRRESRGRRRY